VVGRDEEVARLRRESEALLSAAAGGGPAPHLHVGSLLPQGASCCWAVVTLDSLCVVAAGSGGRLCPWALFAGMIPPPKPRLHPCRWVRLCCRAARVPGCHWPALAGRVADLSHGAASGRTLAMGASMHLAILRTSPLTGNLD
jgi:hypothetical protein